MLSRASFRTEQSAEARQERFLLSVEHRGFLEPMVWWGPQWLLLLKAFSTPQFKYNKVGPNNAARNACAGGALCVFWAEMKAPRVGGWKRRYEAGGGWLCTGRSAGATQDWLLLILLLLLLLLSQQRWVAGSRLGRW